MGYSCAYHTTYSLSLLFVCSYNVISHLPILNQFIPSICVVRDLYFLSLPYVITLVQYIDDTKHENFESCCEDGRDFSSKIHSNLGNTDSNERKMKHIVTYSCFWILSSPYAKLLKWLLCLSGIWNRTSLYQDYRCYSSSLPPVWDIWPSRTMLFIVSVVDIDAQIL